MVLIAILLVQIVWTFFFDDDEKTCISDNVHCVHYESYYQYEGITCDRCTEFYYLDETRTCQKGTIENCQIYSSEDKCYECLNGLQFDSISKQCIKCDIEFCDSCYNSGSTKCKYCKNGYVLNSNETECQKCTAANCGTCIENEPTKCKFCDSGYFEDSDDQCTKCFDNCERCDDYTTCDYCNDNYVRNSNKTECLKSPDNCTTCKLSTENNTECAICTICDYCGSIYDDFEITFYGVYGLSADKTSCDYVIENCLYYYSEEVEKCYQCNFGYVLEENVCNACKVEGCGSCDNSQDTTCNTCGSDYHPITVNGSSTLSSDGSKCIECDTGYTLDKDECYAYTSGATGSDGKDYVCLLYPQGTSEHALFLTEVYEPVNGECENKLCDSAFSVAIFISSAFIIFIL
ncbi:hypothetical protein QTN25_010074 [Entamoeba marina]